MNEIQLLHGDCLIELKKFPDNTFDSIVTDPPYGISFMGKKWDYDVPSVEIWKECLRVLKPGGHLLAFAGTRTQHRMAINIEDAGFEIRDMIAWVYGSGFPKSQNLGNGVGTALKPALEPITMARKPLGEQTIAGNVLKYGTGGLNIDECRVPSKPGEYDIKHYEKEDCFRNDKPKQSKFQVKPQPSGRWPANLIHDGTAEVEAGFPNSKSCDTPSNARSEGTILGGSRTQGQIYPGEDGSASRFFYCPKSSNKDRNDGMRMGVNNHPTVKPVELMKYLIKLITPKDGIVLDPFMGSGSTGVAAKYDNFKFCGIELDKEYFEIAKERIDSTQAPGSLESFL